MSLCLTFHTYLSVLLPLYININDNGTTNDFIIYFFFSLYVFVSKQSVQSLQCYNRIEKNIKTVTLHLFYVTKFRAALLEGYEKKFSRV